MNPVYERKRDRRRAELRTLGGRAYHPHAPHGMVSGYTNYFCRCPECTEAWNEYTRNRRSERKDGSMPPGVVHGKPTTYANWMCKCQPCVSAVRAYNKANRGRK